MTVLALAVLLDLVLGDPPNRWHPVAWMGGLIAAGRRFAPHGSPWVLLAYGSVLIVVVVAVGAGAALALEHALASATEPLRVIIEAWLLKCTFSLRGLFMAVELVRSHLVVGDLDGARCQLGVHLVSRPTGGLDAGGVASGAVESLAENLTDGWVAPLCFFLAGGLAAAWAYRVVNTSDTMIGYRDGDLLYLGRAAARLDDALNFIPARLAAVSVIAGASLARQSPADAWRVMRRDGDSTDSPNAGRTMAAMAGALGVMLEKPAQYRLGDGPAPGLEAMDRGAAVARWAAAVSLGAGFLVLAALSRVGS